MKELKIILVQKKKIKMGTLNKKSQGLPINMIIIAAIVLIVLVVLITIFTGRAGVFTESMKSCEQNGGTCVPKGECENMPANFKCSDKGKPDCCIRTGGFI